MAVNNCCTLRQSQSTKSRQSKMARIQKLLFILFLAYSACGCTQKEEQSTQGNSTQQPVEAEVAASDAAKPISRAIDLAKSSYEISERLAPIVFTGGGTVGMDQLIYGRTIDFPTSKLLGEWPPGGGPEDQTWGDYLYCKDALLTLNMAAMAGYNRSKPPGEQERERFSKSMATCKKALEIQNEQK